MKRIHATRAPALAVGAALALALAACQPADETAETDMAATRDGVVTEASPDATTMSPAAAETPFTPAERQMQQAMQSASGTDTAETWARKMIAHHQGGVQMAEIVLRDAQDPQIREMAQRTMRMQREEVQQLERWLAEHGGTMAPGAPSGNEPAAPAGTAPAPAQ